VKVFYLEMTAEELKANRGFMDAIVDAASGILGSIYGTYTPAPMSEDADEEESEDGGEVGENDDTSDL